MQRLRVHSFSTSLDGYAAGPDQSASAPLGEGAEVLHRWVFDTAYGQAMIGADGGATGTDDEWLRRGDDGIGATVMGRNMFGPVRGPWPDGSWTGWWGEEPPYHHDVFVLTHHGREPLQMAGGTTFHFVTEGLHVALDRAREAAGGLDVRLGGGVATVRAALAERIVDSLHVAVVPVVLGSGERLWEPLGRWPEGYAVVESEASASVLHVRLEPSPD
jgi:dihydrofolate reductase